MGLLKLLGELIALYIFVVLALLFGVWVALVIGMLF